MRTGGGLVERGQGWGYRVVAVMRTGGGSRGAGYRVVAVMRTAGDLREAVGWLGRTVVAVMRTETVLGGAEAGRVVGLGLAVRGAE
jgi:hypothetical protein